MATVLCWLLFQGFPSSPDDIWVCGGRGSVWPVCLLLQQSGSVASLQASTSWHLPCGNPRLRIHHHSPVWLGYCFPLWNRSSTLRLVGERILHSFQGFLIFN